MTDQALCAAPAEVALAGGSPSGEALRWPLVATGDPEVVLAKAHDENFPVASRLLPARQRRHLLAVYGFARLVDDIGDGDLAPQQPAPQQPARQPDGHVSQPDGHALRDRAARLALLDAVEADLDRALAPGGWPEHPLVRRLAATIVEVDLPAQSLRDLIAANRQDQLVTRYETFDDLVGYCRLSADPVGRLVLAIFERTTPDNVRLADAICTGLQLVEHCQDVAEDLARGRIYLPLADLAHFRCDEWQLAGRPTPPQVRALVAYEAHRARLLLRRGAPLVGRLRGRARLAVAGFLAGGLEALDRLAASDFDISSGPPGRSRRRLAGHLALAAVRGR
jgi:squalene synthase HpnC